MLDAKNIHANDDESSSSPRIVNGTNVKLGANPDIDFPRVDELEISTAPLPGEHIIWGGIEDSSASSDTKNDSAVEREQIAQSSVWLASSEEYSEASSDSDSSAFSDLALEVAANLSLEPHRANIQSGASSSSTNVPVHIGSQNVQHLEERAKKGKPRPCKGQRMRFRKLWERLKGEVERAPASFQFENVELPPSLANDEARKAKIYEKLLQHRNYVQALQVVDDWREQQGNM